MAKIRCRGCGKMIDERETSCPYCGKRTGGSRVSLTAKKHKSPLPVLIAAGVAVLVLILAAVLIVPRIASCGGKTQTETYDDGSRKETTLNSDGLPGSYILYDADGEESERGEYAYTGGVLSLETVTYSDGSSCQSGYENGTLASEIWISRDGSRQEKSFDSAGNLLSSVILDPDGEETESEEYRYSDSGLLLYEKLSKSDGSYEEYEYAADGTMTDSVIMNADGSGYRAEYDENGDAIKEIRYYSDGTSEEIIADTGL